MPEEQSADKVKNDLLFIMQCFKEVLIELKEDELAESLPWLDDEANTYTPNKIESSSPLRRSQALSISFQLLNMVE